ncbi:MAG: hypothetical protein Q7U45_14090, partial [Burkholderiaceae bacterium]|nr:hypothetical protein [Burkholderiaceae bacterium]
VVTAYLPSLLAGIARRGDTPGWSFQLALEVLSALSQQRNCSGGGGLSLDALARRLRVSDLQLEEPLEVLLALDWVGRLDEDGQRFVLVADPARTSLAPLIERLLLPERPSTANIWKIGQYRSSMMDSVLQNKI